MPEHPAARTANALAKLLMELQYFLDHPRTQQNQWVAKGARWKPVVEQAIADLEAEGEHYALLVEAYEAMWDALRRVGLDVRQRDQTTWGYSWDGTPLIGAFSSRAQALEAAVRDRLAQPSA